MPLTPKHSPKSAAARTTSDDLPKIQHRVHHFFNPVLGKYQFRPNWDLKNAK